MNIITSCRGQSHWPLSNYVIVIPITYFYNIIIKSQNILDNFAHVPGTVEQIFKKLRLSNFNGA